MSEQEFCGNGARQEKRILVSGCDEQIATRLGRVLSGCAIECAGDDEAILAAIRSQPIDLLVTDREKPAKEAVELLRQINQWNPASKPRVIIMTKEGTRQDVIAAMREHAFSYFSKPHFEAAFDEILRHAMGGDW